MITRIEIYIMRNTCISQVKILLTPMFRLIFLLRSYSKQNYSLVKKKKKNNRDLIEDEIKVLAHVHMNFNATRFHLVKTIA